ncbi:TolC family protein [Alteraurantiacibacter buctensis]|uniref:Type I secretion protein TolC n=1 Tax=Alteraurantiacibacter buctensis TaxID=1503981 RepID=A0A844YV78_9SPHN|nr:TolC family protein [Alteraurantiacibacter buctensis]MXO70930.1 type I secretion protein TolC [Alteraurantiacibacter buctensis]
MRRLPALLLAASCAVAAPPAAAQDLETAIAAALAHSPVLDEADAGAAAAAARLRQAQAERNPLLRVEGSAGLGRIDNRGFFGIAADDVTPLSVQALAEMPLFTGGRLSSALAQAGAGRDAARYGQDQARLEVAVAAVGAYAEVRTSRRLVGSFRQLVVALAETERQAGLRFEAGEIASSDLAQARARRAEAEAGLAQVQGRLASAEAAFERLTGEAPGSLEPPAALPSLPASLGEALELARATNPMLLQAQAGTRAAEAGVAAARAEGMPQLGVFTEASHVADQFFPGYRANSVSAGVRGRWTLFSGGRTGAAVAVSQAEADAADARLQQARLAVDGAVIDAWQAMTAAGRMVEASRLGQAAAAEALRGRRLEAQVGAVPTLAVLDAEREAMAAEAALAEAEGLHLVAAWRLRALTGAID